jgi:hypothetical protein
MTLFVILASGQWGAHFQHKKMPHWAVAYGFNRPIPHKWSWFNHHSRIGKPHSQ